MKKTLHIEGMMCKNCETHIKKALTTIPEVKNVNVNYKSGIATVKLVHDVDDDVLLDAVAQEDYVVTLVE